MPQHEAAICIRATDYSETSQVVHLFTRGAGMVSLLAKGTKRPKSKTAGMIDLLEEGDLVFIASARGGLGTLVEFTETVSHRLLRRDLRRLDAALYMIELVGELMPEADPHPELFDLLHNALARLEQPDARPQAILAYFQWRTLRIAGLLGEMSSCVGCGAELVADAAGRAVWFSSRAGGLLCSACQASTAEKLRLDAVALAGLAALSAAAAGRRRPLPDDQARAVNRLLAYHVCQQLGRPLRMARHVLGSPK